MVGDGLGLWPLCGGQNFLASSPSFHQTGSGDLNSELRAWWPVLFPAEPSCLPCFLDFGFVEPPPPPRSWSSGGCEPSYVDAGIELSSYGEQQALLTAEQSLQLCLILGVNGYVMYVPVYGQAGI